MNDIEEIIFSDDLDADVISDIVLAHYGIKRRSGRYPWGSGENPYQHSGDFISRVKELKDQGLSEAEIIKAMGFQSSTDYRSAYTIAKNEQRSLKVARAEALKQDGKSTSEIAREMGVNESTVRSYLNPESKARMNAVKNTSEILKKELETKHVLDIGAGVERELGVSRKNLEDAAMMLAYQGYDVAGVGIKQLTTKGKQTNTMVVMDNTYSLRDLYQDPQKIKSVGEYHSVDGGQRWDKREYPASIDSKRVAIRYGDQGGKEKDGVIEIRRGVKDLDLGNSHYAQVRIMVDGTHYLKGMAMYSDDIPDGADIVFNTNKKSGTPKTGDNGVLKKIKNDPDNPFGAYIKADGQSYYDDPHGKYTDPITGKKRSLSAINKLREEGDWDTYSRNLSSQFLSKQPMELIQKQLKLTYADYNDRYEEIKSLTNPTIRKQKLKEFAGECDSAAVHLKAAALPRQQSRVILPITQLKDTEVYAPYLDNGERVALIRYPHAGTFEIPVLTVNNKNTSAKKILGNAKDAIGINSKVAERLSGADFDGDSVVVIPVNSKVRVKSTNPLKELKDFDPKVEYSTEGKTGVKLMTESMKGKKMGEVSNLITDMTLRGAPPEDIAKAVRHSMVVIDAVKHKLDYKQSEKDNDIEELKKRYQMKYDSKGNPIGSGGASTLISRHKQTVRVPERRGSGRIDKETGEVTYNTSGRKFINNKGKEVEATTSVPLILNTRDVRSLSSGTPQENAYADYANKMKALANEARKEYAAAPRLVRSPSAAKTYASQVMSLEAKLNVASMDAPKQRQALALANSVVKAKVQSNPELTDKANKDELDKIKRLALEDARISVGASSKRSQIKITDKEWEAIQAGAISDTKLQKILRYSNPDDITKLAMPKATTELSTARVNKIKQMNLSGYTIKEIADSLGVSTSTVNKYLGS